LFLGQLAFHYDATRAPGVPLSFSSQWLAQSS
jgi:hypothetical protein